MALPTTFHLEGTKDAEEKDPPPPPRQRAPLAVRFGLRLECPKNLFLKSGNLRYSFPGSTAYQVTEIVAQTEGNFGRKKKSCADPWELR